MVKQRMERTTKIPMNIPNLEHRRPPRVTRTGFTLVYILLERLLEENREERHSFRTLLYQ
jgi:hypothetical protein